MATILSPKPELFSILSSKQVWVVVRAVRLAARLISAALSADTDYCHGIELGLMEQNTRDNRKNCQ